MRKREAVEMLERGIDDERAVLRSSVLVHWAADGLHGRKAVRRPQSCSVCKVGCGMAVGLRSKGQVHWAL